SLLAQLSEVKKCLNKEKLVLWQKRSLLLARLLERRQEAYYFKAPAPAKTEVSVKENKAKEFLSSLKRQKRQLWDRTQPDVQQWYQQFLYLGFDEAKFEDDVSYWTSLGRGGNEYYGGHYQHHYDEDAPIGPRNPHTFSIFLSMQQVLANSQKLLRKGKR
uniref:ECRG4 augurin n=1 Tax=Crocodylus porosus TaxID=8502 RepID=A0A7M4F908_CROPO